MHASPYEVEGSTTGMAVAGGVLGLIAGLFD
jgi:hypothetical protein